MKEKKGYTNINWLNKMASLVLFLTSYLPLFILIIVRQFYENHTFLSWGGFNDEALKCMVKNFGMSIVCIALSIIGIIGTTLVFKNLRNRVESGHTYRITEVSSKGSEGQELLYTNNEVINK